MKRYNSILDVMRGRGMKPNFTTLDAFKGLPERFYNDWEPDSRAIELNRQRIKERLNATQI
jgi:hypothetical protein